MQRAGEEDEFQYFLGAGLEGDGEGWVCEREVEREDIEAEYKGGGVDDGVQGGAVGEAEERACGVEGAGRDGEVESRARKVL